MTHQVFRFRWAAPALLAAAGLAASANAQQAPRPKPNEARTAAQGMIVSRASPSASAPSALSYEDSVSRRRFILDRSGPDALMKFTDDPEVYALRSTPAQRGDNFLKSDVGELKLRVTELGNVISFVETETGAPASVAGGAPPLEPPPRPASLPARVNEIADRLSQLARHDVTVTGHDAFEGAEEWAAEALTVALRGVQRAQAPGNDGAARLREIRLVYGQKPVATFGNGVLELQVNPMEGYAGRPSSDGVARVLLAAR